MNKNEKG